MSTYGDFSEKMLIALYQESARTERDEYLMGQLADQYGLSGKERWYERLADEWDGGYASEVSRVLGGSAREWGVAISGPGMRYIEQKYGSKEGVGDLLAPVSPPGYAFLTDDNGKRLTDDNGEYYLTEAASPDSALDRTERLGSGVDSSVWTGLPTAFELTEDRRQMLVSLLIKAETDLDAIGGGNSEKAMARAYIVAARTLADAPEPPLDIIWEIIGRANNISGIASLLISIVALFTAAH